MGLSKKAQDIISKNEVLVNANIERWIKDAKDAVELNVDWKLLVNHFNEITGKKTRVVGDKAKKQVRARLREGYTKYDISKAIYNCFHSEHHRNTNHKHLTLEFISRGDKMEMYLHAEPEHITQEQKRNESLWAVLG